jgi:branched-chain amino acid transport system substrate-binding protein
MVDALIEMAGFGVADIAFFTQRDAYGDAGYSGGVEALKRHGLKDEHAVAHGRYERNTVVVENGLADLMQAQHAPKAVIMVGAYAPCSRFIKLARTNGLEATFLNVSFVGTSSLAKSLGADGNGVIITQVVPHYRSEIKVVEEYRKSLRSFNAALQPDFGSLEGYVSTRVLLQSLATVNGTIDRESVVRALEGLGSFDIGLGASLFLDASHHQACHTVWPTVLRDGSPVAMEWRELVRK